MRKFFSGFFIFLGVVIIFALWGGSIFFAFNSMGFFGVILGVLLTPAAMIPIGLITALCRGMWLLFFQGLLGLIVSMILIAVGQFLGWKQRSI